MYVCLYSTLCSYGWSFLLLMCLVRVQSHSGGTVIMNYVHNVFPDMSLVYFLHHCFFFSAFSWTHPLFSTSTPFPVFYSSHFLLTSHPMAVYFLLLSHHMAVYFLLLSSHGCLLPASFSSHGCLLSVRATFDTSNMVFHLFYYFAILTVKLFYVDLDVTKYTRLPGNAHFILN